MSTLKTLAEANEIRIDEAGDSKRTPPFYYDSLRNGLNFYFNTFSTNNASYDFYAIATSKDKKKSLKILESQFLDEENTVLSITNFERFFELFIKDLLGKTHRHLTHAESHSVRSRNTWQLVTNIQSKLFIPYKPDGKIYTIAFRESLNRFYQLIKYTKDPSKQNHPLIKKFIKILNQYSFLDKNEYQETLEFLNWYRDRILHNGNKLPSLRFLDYIVTQKVIPIVLDIYNIKKTEFGDWWFFMETVRGIKILEELASIKWEFKNSKSNKRINEAIKTILFIGHLKELGRANLNMNLYVRGNFQATNEYNYKDPKGRGKRFASIEMKKHSNAMKIEECPCCGEKSLVVYRLTLNDIFNQNEVMNIDWLKCYTCDYHIRYNVGDPFLFNLSTIKYFNR